MNLYTLLINQFCQLDIIYLYVYSQYHKLHDNKCIHENSNQNRHTRKTATTFFFIICFYGKSIFSSVE